MIVKVSSMDCVWCCSSTSLPFLFSVFHISFVTGQGCNKETVMNTHVVYHCVHTAFKFYTVELPKTIKLERMEILINSSYFTGIWFDLVLDSIFRELSHQRHCGRILAVFHAVDQDWSNALPLGRQPWWFARVQILKVTLDLHNAEQRTNV